MTAQLVGAARVSQGMRSCFDDLSAAETAVGSLLRARAMARAPVVSGRLRGSLRAVGPSVRSDLVYAPPIHWGWRARNIRANRFAYDAAIANLDECAEAYADGIQRNLQEI